MKKFIWTLLAAAFMLSSCAKETEIYDNPKKIKSVMFSESVQDYESRSTRAMNGHPIENVPNDADKGLIPNGRSFGVWAWVHDADDDEVLPTAFAGLQNKEVTRGTNVNTATYTYTPVATWPDPAEQKLSFVAIYPYFGSADAAANGGYPLTVNGEQFVSVTLDAPGEVFHGLSGVNFSYMVPAEGEKHIDIMYARQEAVSGYDPVELEFHHALARVRFSALIDGFEPDAEVQITGIKLKNIFRQGALAIHDKPSLVNIDPVSFRTTWSDHASQGDMSVADGTGGRPNHIIADVDTEDGIVGLTGTMSPVTTSMSATSTAGDLLVIPQETQWLSLEITTKVDGEAGKTYSIPLSAAPELKMNEIHDYRIALTPDEGNIDVVVVPWNDSFDEDYDFDGHNRLKVDKGEVALTGIATSATLGIFTDYERSATDKGWKIVLEDESDWFTINKTSGEPGSDPNVFENVTLTLAGGVNIHSYHEGWFTVVAGNMHKRVYVTYDSGFEYVMAPPGVIGIKRSELNKPRDQRNLTLRGSSTYINIDKPFITDEEFGPLENEPVYAVQFMWGSTVAMLGVPGKTWSDEDIVWVNPEFTLDYGGDINNIRWGQSDTASGTSGDNDVIENLPLGNGDPCNYAFHHNGENGGYLTPTGNPWKLVDGTTPFGSTNMSAEAAANAGIAYLTDKIPMGLTQGWGMISGDGKMFFPITANLDVYSADMNGTWQMSSSIGCHTTTFCGALLFSENIGLTVSSYSLSQKNLFLVRCVPQVESVLTIAAADGNDIPYSGGDKNFTVNSYNTDGVAMPWHVEFPDGSGGWTATMPSSLSWLTSITSASIGGMNKTLFAKANILPSGEYHTEDDVLKYTDAPANTIVRADVGSEASPIDLALVDGAINTANCYIVNGPGWYKIPLAYGNAVQKGVNTTSAYTSSISNTQMVSNFVRHDGKAIDNGYIYSNVGWSAADYAPNTTGGATLVWQDAQNLVANVGMSDSGKYLKFYVDRNTITHGNAVVALLDLGGRIMWSWHIWITPLVDNSTPDTDGIKNRTGFTYEFMQYNLGWAVESTTCYGVGVANAEPRTVTLRVVQTSGTNPKMREFTITQAPGTVPHGVNTYYQWGRKDPMPPSVNDATNSDHELFPSKPEYAYGATNLAETDYRLQWAIQHPYLFSGLPGGANWGSDAVTSAKVSSYNLWNMNNTLSTANDNAVTKTVYDPNPYGFKMPPGNAWTGFAKTVVGDGVNGVPNDDGRWQRGLYFYKDYTKSSPGDPTVFFPTSGYRDYATVAHGALGYVGTQGYYWSASPYSTSGYSREFFFRSSIASPLNYTARAYGFSVRPVKDAVRTSWGEMD